MQQWETEGTGSHKLKTFQNIVFSQENISFFFKLTLHLDNFKVSKESKQGVPMTVDCL